MSPQDRERAILEEVQKNLISEGYEVVIYPNKLLVPPFLGSFRPDALAFRSDKNLVVEIATQSPSTERRLRDLREKMAHQTEWGLRLVWSSPGAHARALQRASTDSIDNTIEEVEKLVSSRYYRPALMLGWAALEALGRNLIPTALARPQSPARLIEHIASRGVLSPSEADEMRELISKRNRIVHGELQTDVRRKDLLELIRVLKMVRDQVTL
ncbi:hypothetical protein [Sphingobium subterraneum]|uniref:Uncharacterized protein YutE (UPF0331/DUF86 family) n=1 Tax=Sphingobium subterraneum TaxID=627688 RepID=A0A841IYU4_9SPHN|nr:hypothetical protein [Sphingobium subterraneum]MBB6123833.1 uncharacterized protein YutE (UPF0331/DUF86 family) [Sphingobium subterraneum]